MVQIQVHATLRLKMGATRACLTSTATGPSRMQLAAILISTLARNVAVDLRRGVHEKLMRCVKKLMTLIQVQDSFSKDRLSICYIAHMADAMMQGTRIRLVGQCVENNAVVIRQADRR